MSAQHTPGPWVQYTHGRAKALALSLREYRIRQNTTSGLVETDVKAVRMTPTGRIQVALPGGTLEWFNPDGWARGMPGICRWLVIRATIAKAAGGAS